MRGKDKILMVIQNGIYEMAPIMAPRPLPGASRLPQSWKVSFLKFFHEIQNYYPFGESQ